jgi:hypothetical protein
MRPFDAVREAILTTARRSSQEAMVGAVRGLREEIPEDLSSIERPAAQLLEDLARFVHEAYHEKRPLQELANRLNRLLGELERSIDTRNADRREPADRARAMAAGAIEGAVQGLVTKRPELDERLKRLPAIAEELGASVGRGFVRGTLGAISEDQESLRLPMVHAGREVTKGVLDTIAQRVLRRGPLLLGLALSVIAGVVIGRQR